MSEVAKALRGELKNITEGKMHLLPPSPDVCQVCAIKHDIDSPHDAMSLYYQFKFHGEHGRWPTWADAMSHCGDGMKEAWTMALSARSINIDEPAAAPPRISENSTPEKEGV